MECPKCGYLMTPFDETCPRCHGEGTQSEATPTPPAVVPARAPLWRYVAVGLGAVVVLAVVTAVLLARRSPSPDATAARAEAEYDAMMKAASRGDIEAMTDHALRAGAAAHEAAEGSKQRRQEADMSALENASVMFRNDTGRWPERIEDLFTAPTWAGRDWQGPYLSRSTPPTDPWSGQPYQLRDGQVIAP